LQKEIGVIEKKRKNAQRSRKKCAPIKEHRKIYEA
jgi:hypothetical protein